MREAGKAVVTTVEIFYVACVVICLGGFGLCMAATFFYAVFHWAVGI